MSKLKPLWLLEESGAVTSDGMIRTQSPPFNGITRPGEYAVLYSGQAGNVNLVKGKINISYDFPAAFYGLLVPPSPNIGDVAQTGFGIVLSSFGNNKNQLTSQINQQLESLHTAIKQIELINQYIDRAASITDLLAAISSDKNLDQNIVQHVSTLIKSFNLKSGALGQLTDPNFFVSIPAFQVSYDISSVKIVQVPTVGLPVVTDAKVQLNPDGTSSFETTLNLPASTTADSSAPPVLLSSELKFKDSSGNPFPNGCTFAHF